MKLRYKVTRENYIEMLENQIRRRGRRPLSIFITILGTIVQFGLYLYLVATARISGTSVLIIGAMSIFVAAATVSIRLLTHRRAVVALERFEMQGKLSPEFWKEHVLTIGPKLVTVRSGSLKYEYDLSDLNGYDELPSSLLLYCSGTVADIVPLSAIPDKAEFIKAVADAQHEKVVEEADDLRDDVPLVYKYHFHYAYTLEQYVSQQQEGYRKMYTTKLIFTMSNVVRLGISLYALGYMFFSPSPLSIAVCLAAIIVFNLQHIITFTPISSMTIKHGISDVLAHKPDPNTDTYITADNIIIRGSMHSLDIPICDIKAMRRIKGGVALYLPKGVVLTIPETKDGENADFENFVKFMDYKAN